MSACKRDELHRRLKKRRMQLERGERLPLVNVKPASFRTMKRVAGCHVDLLQNIESAILDCCRRDLDNGIDDASVLKSLRQFLLGKKPADSPQGLVVEALNAVREFRSEVPDELFRDAVRVVMASVETHSTLARGETSYLDFVQDFLP